MNKVILVGRLTADPKANHLTGDKPLTIASYTLAVDREFKKDEADFISIKAFGKAGDFAEKYLKKGTKIAVIGRLQVSSYRNKNGDTVWKTDVVAESQEFCESKKADGKAEDDGFMNIDDSSLPFM